MPKMEGYRAPQGPPDPRATRQYKMRIENPWPGCHAMELWIESPSIMAAGNGTLEKLNVIGIEESQVSKLIEIDR